MKIGAIIKTNQKGQIVIPKKFREALGITPQTHLNLVLRGGGMYVCPIDEVVTKLESESPYLAILEKTQGAWANADWKEFDKREKRRRKIELAASKKRKKAW